jgi:cytochrome c-type biogenesis protein CcmI
VTFTLGAVLLVAAAVLFIIQPLLTGESASLDRTEDEMTEAESKRRVKLLALRDVEYDFATGKLDEDDYKELRRELSSEALAALDEAEREASEPALNGDDPTRADVEREVARVRKGLQEGSVCSSCGHANRAGSRFCSGCGEPLRAGSAAED